MGRRQKLKKEEIAEDWCFDCKDGGTLMICDHKDCLKAYHPSCVNKDNSAMTATEKWTCNLHICFKCDKAPKFYCLCCPSAICGPCLYEAEFAVVKGDKGLCDECLELVLRKEEKKDVDPNQCKNDFSDPSTKEFFFYDYWRIIKKKECLTSEEVIAASNLLKRGENYKFASDSDEYDIGKEKKSSKRKRPKSSKRKRPKRKQSAMKSKFKSSRKEFVGWGSKSLLEFLVSIGKDTTRKLSKQVVAIIIREYCKENNLFHPDKKEICCDAKLQALLGRKSVEKRKLCELLTIHFAENLDCSEEELLCISENEDDDSVACKRQMHSSSVQKALSKEEVAEVTAEAQGAKPAGRDSTGTNEKEHNVGVPQSPQLNTSLYDGLTDIVEYNHLLRWCEETERSNGEMSVERDKMQSEQPLQSLHEVPIVFADTDYAESAWKVYSRRNRQECREGLPELSSGMISNGNGISFHMPSIQPKLSNELPVGIVVSHVEPVSEESSLGRTSNSNGVTSHIPSEQPLLSNEVPVVIAAAEHVEPTIEDSVRAKEQVGLPESSLVRTSEGNAIPCDMIPDLSVAPPSQPSTAIFLSELPEASAPSSQPSTAVFQSEHPEASAPPSKPAPTICKPQQKVIMIDLLDERDVKEEREEINRSGENDAFFEDLQFLLDQSLEDLSGPSEQPPVTHTLSPDQIMEAKRCLHMFCLMNFDQLIDHAERDQFFSSLDLLLKHGFVPKHMLDMVTNLQLTLSSSTFLYSQCQESVRRADEERERAESLKQELADKFRLYEEIERKNQVAAHRIEELKNQLKDVRDSRIGLYEQSKSLKASLETSKVALYQYMQSSKTFAMIKETGQQVMKDIDESWNSSKTEILNLLLDFSP